MKNQTENLRWYEYLFYIVALIGTFILCIGIGSVKITSEWLSNPIIIYVRIPRVLCAALLGAALALSGATMQGLLRNPLADGSTIGVSSGASLGAVIAIAFGINISGIPFAGTVSTAMIFAFISLLFILSLAYKIDNSLTTNTIILIGIIFSMFINSIISFIIVFAGDKVRQISFWTMGSLSGSSNIDALFLSVALIIFGGIIFCFSQELNAFALGEESARHIGVNVKKVKLLLLISVSVLIGVCVSTGGNIAFAGLVIPHIIRLITGPNHKKLLPASFFSGAIFLMLSDLVSRTIFAPIELPIGVITSFIGSVVFVYIFYSIGGKK